MEKIVVIDTNIVVQFNWLGIPWNKMFDCDKVIIAITPILTYEIDKLRSNQESKKRQKKAKDFHSNYLKRFLTEEGDIAINNSVYLRNETPNLMDVNADEENRLSQDSLHVNSALRLQAKYSDIEVVFCSGDTFPLFIAKNKGLQIKLMPDSFLIKEVKDPHEIEYERVKKELESYKNRTPILDINFDKNDKWIELQKPEFNEEALQSYALMLRSALDEHTVMKTSKERQVRASNAMSPHGADVLFAGMRMFDIPDDKIIEYNRLRQVYLKEMGVYTSDLIYIEKAQKLRFKLDLTLANLGTLTANNVRLQLLLPDGVVCHDSLEIKKPHEPKKPTRPSGFTSAFIDYSLMGGRFTGDYRPLRIKEGRKVYEREIKRIQHQNFQLIDDVIFSFDSENSISSFGISYKLNCDEVPIGSEGVLQVKIV